ncbi:MAG: hypothetical protein ABH831_02170 [Candidatus Nealsonbacteria bacterium]
MGKELFLEIEILNPGVGEIPKIIRERKKFLVLLQIVTGLLPDWRRVPVRCFADGGVNPCLEVMVFLDDPNKIDPKAKALASARITERFCSLLYRDPAGVNINIGAPKELLRGSHYCAL